MLKVNVSGQNSLRCQTYANAKDNIELKLYFNAQRKMQHLCISWRNPCFEDWIFVRLSSLVIVFEWTTNRNKFIVKSIDFDRFITSEGSFTLILPFTSKTEQSVAQSRQNIFNLGFTSKERTFFGIL